MLEDKIEIHMAIHDRNMFMQDGAPCHLSKLVSDFLEEKNVKTLNWLGNSPDLKYFENLWAILKDKMASEHLTSNKHLEIVIKDMLSCCLQTVTKNKGGFTKY